MANDCPDCGAARTPEAKICTRCGAPLSDVPTRVGSQGGKINGVLVPTPLFVMAACLLFVGALFSLFVLLYGGLGHSWGQLQHGGSVAYYNTTDELLCASESPSCGAE